MRLRILPYKMGSQSAKALARELSCLRVYTDSVTYKPKRSHVIINWGLSTIPTYVKDSTLILNKFSAVKIACNKYKTLDALWGTSVPHPAFCHTKESAIEWIEEGYKVYCRQTLTGHSGSGIIIASTVDELVDAPLYTKEVKAGKEYRVHVFNGEVIDYAKKGRRAGTDEGDRPSHLIRNYSKGWLFLHENIELPKVVAQESIRAVKALGLDFGAVDVATIKGTDDTQCVIYEVNTACGMQGRTIKSYADAIKKYLRSL